MRRHHVIGAGAIASALGIYSYAARLGLAPADLPSAVRLVTGAAGPLTPGPPIVGPPLPANVPAGSYPSANQSSGDMACFFSPDGGCTQAVVAQIGQARQQILVQAYSFTSVPIAQALVEAHNRGVAVYIILDKSQRTEQYSGADFVAHAGIPTLIDAAHAIAHNKIMLIDGQVIITGSFNFTANAERNNAENLLVIKNRPDLYQAYAENFRRHYQHSQPYAGRGMSGAFDQAKAPGREQGAVTE